jgi:hypothetical protein
MALIKTAIKLPLPKFSGKPDGFEPLLILGQFCEAHLQAALFLGGVAIDGQQDKAVIVLIFRGAHQIILEIIGQDLALSFYKQKMFSLVQSKLLLFPSPAARPCSIHQHPREWRNRRVEGFLNETAQIHHNPQIVFYLFLSA